MRYSHKSLRFGVWVLMVVLVLLPLLTSCSTEDPEHMDYCMVVIENSDDYAVFGGKAKVRRGADVTFRVQLPDNRKLLGADYPDYTITEADVSVVEGTNYQEITLHQVRYSVVVRLTTYQPSVIHYYANGGTRLDGEDAALPVSVPGSQSHLRHNTETGIALFHREGYTIIGWNTSADGSGISVGLGSRVDDSEEVALYAQWSPWANVSDFSYERIGDGIRITDYTGKDTVLTIPGEIEGLPVTQIASGAFREAACQTVILPQGLQCVEPLAFENAGVQVLSFFDTLERVSDICFSGCPLTTLRIHAARPPVYSGTYFDTFPDKMDWLMCQSEARKIVLVSGSSARFGYDSPRLDGEFPSYTVANMGVYAYSNMLPQYFMILPFMQAGDILLSAPEFDAIPEQFCVTNAISYEFYAMIESNYDLLSLLDCRELSGVLDAFQEFQQIRSGMEAGSYDISPKNYDENHNPVADFETYNHYGDYIYPRPNQEQDALFGIKLADYETASYPAEVVEGLNRVFRRFQEKGVSVWFSYAPRSRQAVTAGSTEAERQRLDAHLKNLLCVPVISSIESSLFSGHYFYETDNHLSDEGVQIRTAQIMEDLLAQMEREGMTP